MRTIWNNDARQLQWGSGTSLFPTIEHGYIIQRWWTPSYALHNVIFHVTKCKTLGFRDAKFWYINNTESSFLRRLTHNWFQRQLSAHMQIITQSSPFCTCQHSLLPTALWLGTGPLSHHHHSRPATHNLMSISIDQNKSELILIMTTSKKDVASWTVLYLMLPRTSIKTQNLPMVKPALKNTISNRKHSLDTSTTYHVCLKQEHGKTKRGCKISYFYVGGDHVSVITSTSSQDRMIIQWKLDGEPWRRMRRVGLNTVGFPNHKQNILGTSNVPKEDKERENVLVTCINHKDIRLTSKIRYKSQMHCKTANWGGSYFWSSGHQILMRRPTNFTPPNWSYRGVGVPRKATQLRTTLQ